MRAAVILSGCGYLDGAEIRESVLSLLYLDQAGVQADIFAPDKSQHHVVDHTLKEAVAGGRNMMIEAARIARSAIAPLTQLAPAKYDLLVIPGGYGVAKNLSDFAFEGANATVDADFKAVIEAFFAAKKPIVAICIAPAVLAAALKGKGLTLTIGDDAGTASAITSLGHTHVPCASDVACIDAANRVVSCSAYMREDAIAPIAKGIEAAIAAGVKLAKEAGASQAA